MSRVYTVDISSSAERFVKAKDKVCTELKLLPLLPKPRMEQLLAEELENRGFAIEDGEAVREEGDGIEIRVDLKTGEVSAQIEVEKRLQLRKERQVRIEEEVLERQTQAEEQRLQQQLEDQLDSEERRLSEEATQRLEGKLRDLQKEINDITNKVMGNALREKAGQLGEITELSEDPETGAMTIRVKV